MGKPHVMMVPFPMQGHVIPLLELAHTLATRHITITFVNTDFIHDRIIRSFSIEDDDTWARIRFVSIPDGLGPVERYIPGRLTETVYDVIPGKIEELVVKMEEEEERVRCLVYDQSIGRIQQVANKLGIGSVAFLPAAAASLVLGFNIPKLIEDGIVDDQGTPLDNKTVQFSPTMPIISPSDFIWHRVKIPSVQKLIFDIMRQNNGLIQSADWVLCNSVYDLEPGAFTLAPNILPVGPLLATNRREGHFWKPDSDSLKWLDHQPPCSVIYAAFGSSTMFNRSQFQELALGLEQTNRPFLWVVRPGTVLGLEEQQVLPEGFLERVSGRARIIGWAPQQKVLRHPSIACFISHCGWNSTVESVSNGVPILCWPYIADQFINQSYICDIWKVGMQFDNDCSGNITSGEIKKKIDLLLGGGGGGSCFKERALKLMEMIERSAREGGDSDKNLRYFISWILK